jgi:hypothetical protein
VDSVVKGTISFHNDEYVNPKRTSLPSIQPARTQREEEEEEPQPSTPSLLTRLTVSFTNDAYEPEPEPQLIASPIPVSRASPIPVSRASPVSVSRATSIPRIVKSSSNELVSPDIREPRLFLQETPAELPLSLRWK